MKLMGLSNSLARFPAVLVIAVSSGAFGINAFCATKQPQEQARYSNMQRTFASPDDAVVALKAATEADDRTAMHEIFGPDIHDLLTGDQVQDANNRKRFAQALEQRCNQVREGDDKIVLEVGTNDWPMPIPLVKADGQWRFDTSAGKEEIINRHIGKDELHAIGVCRAYVEAQRKYASMNHGATGQPTYAQKIKSTPGNRDGLYWETSGGEPGSPFGPLVDEARAEGYSSHKEGTGPHPFHGYYFRILTRQGKEAPGGKMNYVRNGEMTGGFALVAYPERWGRSGVMTFIVNQDGMIYQRNLGEQTARIAASMQEYNPNRDWTVVEDQGIVNAVSER